MKKRLFVIGNWKMNMTRAQAKAFLRKLKVPQSARGTVGIAASHTLLPDMKFPRGVVACGQDVSAYESGPYTGDVSAKQLKDVKVQYCLVGHSERRLFHRESSEVVARKAVQLQQQGIIPIICVGETAQDRKQGKTKKVLAQQLKQSLQGVNVGSCVIAYEPVWAISTFQKTRHTQTATLKDIQEAHTYIRQVMNRQKVGVGKKVPVLYGGSVTARTSADIMALSGVDGVLVGGASLVVSSFTDIINNALHV